MAMDPTLVRQMRERFQQELDKKEREVTAYWREEIDKLLKRRHQSLAGLKNDIEELSRRMARRSQSR